MLKVEFSCPISKKCLQKNLDTLFVFDVTIKFKPGWGIDSWRWDECMGLGLSANLLFLRTLMMEYFIHIAIGFTGEGLALQLNPFVVSTCLLILLNATQRLRGYRTSQQIRFTNIGGFLNNKICFPCKSTLWFGAPNSVLGPSRGWQPIALKYSWNIKKSRGKIVVGGHHIWVFKIGCQIN